MRGNDTKSLSYKHMILVVSRDQARGNKEEEFTREFLRKTREVEFRRYASFGLSHISRHTYVIFAM